MSQTAERKTEKAPVRRRAAGASTRATRSAGLRAVDPRSGLWRAFLRRRGCAERNALVESYQELVAQIVHHFAARLPRSVERGDLLTAANVGLMAALESFERARGVPFEAYGELRIKGALLDELRTQDWLPRPWRARLERQKRALQALRARLGCEPCDDDVAAALDMAPDDYRLYFGSGWPAAPLPAATLGEGAAPLDVVADTNADAPGERLTREELLALVAQRLTAQEYRIVYLKYWEDLPMREIGELVGLSEARVSRIHMHLLARLRERFHRGAGDA